MSEFPEPGDVVTTKQGDVRVYSVKRNGDMRGYRQHSTVFLAWNPITMVITGRWATRYIREDCSTCASGSPVPHVGSAACRSGGKPHCSCSACF